MRASMADVPYTTIKGRLTTWRMRLSYASLDDFMPAAQEQLVMAKLPHNEAGQLIQVGALVCGAGRCQGRALRHHPPSPPFAQKLCAAGAQHLHRVLYSRRLPGLAAAPAAAQGEPACGARPRDTPPIPSRLRCAAQASVQAREDAAAFDVSRLVDFSERVLLECPAAQLTPLVREPGR
jgi:hypothetical protein